MLFASANAQMALISDLLDFSRMESGNRQLVERAVRAGRGPEGPDRDDAGRGRQEGDRLRRRLGRRSTGLTVRGDERAFRQIVTNLLGNAVKFTDARRRRAAAPRLDRDGDRVGHQRPGHDTGRGIPAEALPHIFERFYQVDSSLTRRTEGTGLGLAISQNLARMMGGRIEVASEPGVGSTFTLSVDLRGRRAARRRAMRPEGAEAGRRRASSSSRTTRSTR